MPIKNLPTYQKMGGVIATVASLLAISTPAQALTLLGNYPTLNQDDNGNLIGKRPTTNNQLALGFDIPSGNNYILNNIRLRLFNYNTSDPIDTDFAALTILIDPLKTSNNPIGLTTALSSTSFFYPNSSSNNINNFLITPSTSFTFQAETRYWLLIDADGGLFTTAASRTSNGSDANIPSGIATNPLIVFSDDNGGSYGSRTLFNTFEINTTQVTPVPFESNPAIGVGMLVAAFVIKKQMKKK